MNIVKSNLSFKDMSYVNNPDTIVLHHAESSKCTVEDIHRWHLDRGWSGIGYHFFVKKDGTIYTGRPENAIGAHCLYRNTDSIGICCEGMYNTEIMPSEQRDAVVELIKDIKSRYNITGIFGHRELMATSCPGDRFPLNTIKSLANNSFEFSDIGIKENRTYLQVGDTGEKVAYLQKSLISLGFDLGAYGADGDYGKVTKNAVYKFQKSIGIEADGLAGVQTFKALDEIIKLPLCSIKYQENDFAVRFIQYKLNLYPDGLFGSFTEECVKTFQKKCRLSQDGIVGPKTWAKLMAKK